MEETKRCPYCGEEIRHQLKKCRYYGNGLIRNLQKGTYSSDDVPKQNGNPYFKDNERKGNGLILILSISIAIVIVIGGFIFYQSR